MFEFFLPNIDFGLADHMTVGAVSVNGQPGERKIRDRIEFEIEGRQWCLRKLGVLGEEMLPVDVAFAKAKADGNEHAEIKLCENCVLQVGSQGLSDADASKLAEDICWLLQIALGQKVAWTQLAVREGNVGNVLRHRAVFCAEQPSKSTPIRNWANGELKKFIENAYPVFATNPDWWRVTADWLAIAYEHSAIQAAGLTCSVLLDRATRFLLKGQKFPKQIDDVLNEKLAEKSPDRPGVVDAINQAFGRITPKWTEERTRKILGMVLQWNSEPPYEQKIARVFESVGLPVPDEEVLAHRNSLAHEGQLKSTGTPVTDYYAKITDVVTTLLLRMLNYKGRYYVLGVGEKTL